MKTQQKFLINSAIFLCLAVAVIMFIVTLVNIPVYENSELRNLLSINHFSQRFLAVLLALIVFNLYERKFSAWLLTVLVLSVSLVLYIVHHHFAVLVLVIALQFYCLAILLVFHRNFRKFSDRPSITKSVIVLVVVVAVLLINAVIGHLILHTQLTVAQSFSEIIDYLFVSGGTTMYSKFLVYFIWICFGICVILVLQPVLYKAIISPQSRQKALELIRKYGHNPASYLAIEGDKKLFFGSHVDGVIAYGTINKCVIVQGDPICSEDDFVSFLSEFRLFCAENDYSCLFIGAMEKHLKDYDKLGYEHVKCAEEARMKLDEYQLAGGTMAKMRAEVNHAKKAGLTVEEYKPNEKRDPEIENAIGNVTAEWLGGKKSSQLAFSVGDVNLDNPLDRRYFYARTEDGRIVAFNVYLPFGAMTGYMADVTRRTHDAPSGVTEMINFEAFMKFRDEGYIWGSLGDSPLSNVAEGDNTSKAVAKVLEFAYEKLNKFYGFKALHHAKEKYVPTSWNPSYFVYSKGAMNMDMALAVVRIQNPGGISDFVTTFIKDSVFRKK